MRVLLLNPPATRVVLRDYLCSKTTKAAYLYHPIDLLFLSGTLAAEHQVLVLDCVAERLRAEDARERIEAVQPEVVISLVASVSWLEDRPFLAELARTGSRVIVLGDLMHEGSEERLHEEGWIEAALHDFTNGDACAWLAGRKTELENMTVRDESGRPSTSRESHTRLAPSPDRASWDRGRWPADRRAPT
jgi:hypothetical protein